MQTQTAKTAPTTAKTAPTNIAALLLTAHAAQR